LVGKKKKKRGKLSGERRCKRACLGEGGNNRSNVLKLGLAMGGRKKKLKVEYAVRARDREMIGDKPGWRSQKVGRKPPPQKHRLD